jgi:hypothetical protein
MPSSPEPWPEKYVHQRTPSRANVDEFDRVLRDAADERALQSFLAATPCLLRALVPGSIDFWCFDRPRLGAELVPDFLLCRRDSTGFVWTLVELEGPTQTVLNQSGRPSGKLAQALGQIRDWRVWLRQNVAYAQTQLALKEINAECDAFTIIGRRASLDPKHITHYRELSNDNTKVLTYDRLVEIARANTQP